MKEFKTYTEFYSLMFLAKRFTEKKLNREQIEKISGPNSWIIGYIGSSDSAVFQRDLEHEFGINRSSASKIIDNFVTRGLLTREPTLEDGRLRKLTLTPKGEEVTKLFTEDESEINEAMLQGFTSAEKENLQSYINRIKKNLE